MKRGERKESNGGGIKVDCLIPFRKSVQKVRVDIQININKKGAEDGYRSNGWIDGIDIFLQ